MGYSPPSNQNGMNDTSKVAAMSDEETENPFVKRNTKEHPGRAKEVEKIIKDATKKIFGEETIDEAGRGRPRKNPLPANAEPADPEPSDNIMNRVRQSMYSMAGGPQHTITHKDGSKTQLTKNVARVIHNMHAGLKTADQKDDFVDKLQHSHGSLKKTLGY